MTIWLAPELETLNSSAAGFDSFLSMQGDVYRDLPTRRTLRFIHAGQAYFIKIHFGVGWKEIFKNLLRGRLPILNAGREASALQALHQHDITSMQLMGYGQRGRNPATQQSFVITKALDDTIDLEQFIADGKYGQSSRTEKSALIEKLARLASNFQAFGFVHYDFYLCHFLLNPSTKSLHLIDCHRVQQYQFLPDKQRIRDLAGLYFSSLQLPLSHKDRLRFLRAYFGMPLRQCITQHKKLLKSVNKRTSHLYQRVHVTNCTIGPLGCVAPISSLPLSLQYLDAIFALKAPSVATSTLNDTLRYEVDKQTYFVKRYYAAGKGLRRYLGRSRLRGELDNLRWFKKLGLSTPVIMRFTEQRRWGQFKRGVLITKAVDGVVDLKTLKRQNHACFKQKAWRQHFITTLATVAKRFHDAHFIHHDLKWRNILVSPDDNMLCYFIDCPLGQKHYGHWFTRGVIKDLMSLDKEAKGFLTRSDRLRFYLCYIGKSRLSDVDKQHIAKIQVAYR